MSTIILFGTGRTAVGKHSDVAIGSRGERAVSLAELDMPICPGFVIPNDGVLLCAAEPEKAAQQLKQSVAEVEKILQKDFGGDAPLLLKVVESPMLNVQSSLPSVHHIGLTDTTVERVAEMTGEKFAYHEYAYLLRNILLAEIQGCSDDGRVKELQAYLDALKKAKTKATIQKAMQEHRDVLPAELYSDPYFQLLYVVQLFSAAYALSPTTEDSAVQVQAMVYGNLDKNSCAGYMYTHHIVTGADELQGEFFPASFDETAKNGKPIKDLDASHLKSLLNIARKLEDHFREIRWVRFVIEANTLWVVDQASVPNKSAQAEIRTLLDLEKREIVSKDYLIEKVKPGRLSEILHPTLDVLSVKSLPSIGGGIAGAVGAAIGRVFFTAESLITAYRQAQQAGEDTNMILAMPSTYAEDVKAIEVS
ncbi:MAG: pyruvate, phosphate dikinase, partial [Spirochaeta sp.]